MENSTGPKYPKKPAGNPYPKRGQVMVRIFKEIPQPSAPVLPEITTARPKQAAVAARRRPPLFATALDKAEADELPMLV
ncbi:hypothetical protein B296_00005655 [Ensete ventricosum]|uniref:Uncharacterized protein n=1 Tax=Ensete ventricosum TaxID=4639 RepID=A0A426ZNX0_ENSVE|nr:hypothetical protein B296_00005655 [Ensete ventricosum]